MENTTEDDASEDSVSQVPKKRVAIDVPSVRLSMQFTGIASARRGLLECVSGRSPGNTQCGHGQLQMSCSYSPGKQIIIRNNLQARGNSGRKPEKATVREKYIQNFVITVGLLLTSTALNAHQSGKGLESDSQSGASNCTVHNNGILRSELDSTRKSAEVLKTMAVKENLPVERRYWMYSHCAGLGAQID